METSERGPSGRQEHTAPGGDRAAAANNDHQTRHKLSTERAATQAVGLPADTELGRHAAHLVTTYGLAVFPVDAAKHPLLKAWQDTAARTPDAALALFSRYPRAVGIGLAHRLSGTVAADIDRHAADGTATWLELVAANGDPPATLAWDTPSGGRQMLFRRPEWMSRDSGNKAGVLGPGVDVIAGYSVAPPSTTAKGAYRWQTVAAIAACPDWIAAPFRPKPRQSAQDFAAEDDEGDPVPAGDRSTYGIAALQRIARDLAAVLEGARNVALNRAAWALGTLAVACGISEEAAWTVLHDACLANGLVEDIGLEGCRKTFLSGWQAGLLHPRVPRSRRASEADVAAIHAFTETVAPATFWTWERPEVQAAFRSRASWSQSWRGARAVALAIGRRMLAALSVTVHPGDDALADDVLLTRKSVARHRVTLERLDVLQVAELGGVVRDRSGRVTGRKAASLRLSQRVTQCCTTGEQQPAVAPPAERVTLCGKRHAAGFAVSRSDVGVHPMTVWHRLEASHRPAVEAYEIAYGSDPMIPVVRWSAVGGGEMIPVESLGLDPERGHARGLPGADVLAAVYDAAETNDGAALLEDVAALAHVCAATARKHLRAFVKAGKVEAVELPTAGRPATGYMPIMDLDKALAVDGPVTVAVASTRAAKVEAERLAFDAIAEAGGDPRLPTWEERQAAKAWHAEARKAIRHNDAHEPLAAARERLSRRRAAAALEMPMAYIDVDMKTDRSADAVVLPLDVERAALAAAAWEMGLDTPETSAPSPPEWFSQGDPPPEDGARSRRVGRLALGGVLTMATGEAERLDAIQAGAPGPRRIPGRPSGGRGAPPRRLGRGPSSGRAPPGGGLRGRGAGPGRGRGVS